MISKRLKEKYIKKIEELKKSRNAIILAHIYQRGEIQDIADYIGDSLDLSRIAIDTKAKVIVFCGVRFMAETAAILNPDKAVLLPDKGAGCELADMATVKGLLAKRKKYSDVPVVSYVNTSDAVKAESDICCTSANAVDVVNSLDKDHVLFLPDKNLGSHVAENSNKEIILWHGYCYVHEKNITPKKIEGLKKAHPNARIVVHPECNKPVRDLANFIGGTGQIREYVKESKAGQFIVGTEDGIIHTLKKENPDKIFYPLETICKGMKKTTLEKVKISLERMEHKVYIPEETRFKARKALEKMLRI